MTIKYPAIPQPAPTVESLQETVLAMKSMLETITRQRTGQPLVGAVLWQDLVDLNLIKLDQAPRS